MYLITWILGLSVLDLGPMYATDRETDRRQTDFRQHHCLMPRLLGAGHNKSVGQRDCGTLMTFDKSRTAVESKSNRSCNCRITVTVWEAIRPKLSLICGSSTWTSTRGISPGPSLMTLNFCTRLSVCFTVAPTSPASFFVVNVISLSLDLTDQYEHTVLLSDPFCRGIVV